MDTRSISARSTIVFALACGGVASADIIVDQPDLALPGYASQDFPDFPDFTCSVFDDFTLTQSYELTALRVYGENSFSGGEAEDIDVRLRIFTDPNLLGSPLAAVSGTDINGVLSWDLTGITLGPGTYWISAQVERPFNSGGQWYWRASATTNGAHAMWHNPGGGFGLGTDPISTESLGSQYYDMAFTLEGVVPVPGAAALLALGGLARGVTTRDRNGRPARRIACPRARR